MIPFTAFDTEILEEKPEPDYYVCRDGFDYQTGGRVLSKKEKQLLMRLEFYDRARQGEGLGSLLQGSASDVHLDSGEEERRAEGVGANDERAWFGVPLGRGGKVRG